MEEKGEKNIEEHVTPRRKEKKREERKKSSREENVRRGRPNTYRDWIKWEDANKVMSLSKHSMPYNIPFHNFCLS